MPVDLGKTLAPILTRHKIPGLAALVLRGDKVAGQGVAGGRKAGSPERITINDKFYLGSNTKAMTATVVAMLVEEGKLKWTTTLGELFAGELKGMRSDWQGVTLRQVLTHRAGFARSLGLFLRARLFLGKKSLSEQRREVVAAALSRAPKFGPGTKYSYSNLGYILVGAVIEKITGHTWEHVVRERLLQPLAIRSGGFGAPSAAGKLDQPRGHHPSGRPAAAAADILPVYGPAGLAHMTIGDWAKFVALHLRGNPANPHAYAALLKTETFAALHTPMPGEEYASGWVVVTRPWAKGDRPDDIGRALMHPGSNGMWYSTAWIAPEIDFAMLIACNQGGDKAAKANDEAAVALVKIFARAESR